MITTHFDEIKKRIEEARQEANLYEKITIVGVTKYQSIEDANKLIDLGISDIAENHVQALKERSPQFHPCTKHLIGHLQTNKVRDAVSLADIIQSVDSVKLLREIEKNALKQDKIQKILIQVNIAKEECKSGAFIENLPEIFDVASDLPHISIKGLMAIMPIETKLLYYKEMYALFLDKREDLVHNNNRDFISMDYLSMGMSGDYETAIRCGANMVRLGRCLFENTNNT